MKDDDSHNISHNISLLKCIYDKITHSKSNYGIEHWMFCFEFK